MLLKTWRTHGSAAPRRVCVDVRATLGQGDMDGCTAMLQTLSTHQDFSLSQTDRSYDY